MRVVNVPAADREFAKVVRHYLKERPTRAPAFIQAIDHGSALLAENPYIGQEDDDGVRGYVLNGFPYTIHYVIRQDVVLVVAIAHQSRRSGYWRKRLKFLEPQGTDVRDGTGCWLTIG